MNDFSYLFSRADDLLNACNKGYVTSTPFLTPGEHRVLCERLVHRGANNRFFSFGGYEGAERNCVFFVPDFYESFVDFSDGKSALVQYCMEDVMDKIAAAKICGSGYKKLTHRDYLGALLNMGIDRDTLGDICPLDDYSCVIFMQRSVLDFLLTSLEKIGSDKVKITDYQDLSDFTYEKKTVPLSDTVASPRLDSVVSALTKESREKAKNLILSELVELNYLPCIKTDMKVEAGDTVSVRGHGKFIVKDISDQTKKGRLWLRAEKYV